MVPSLYRGAAHGLFASGPANYLASILSLSTAATTANLAHVRVGTQWDGESVTQIVTRIRLLSARAHAVDLETRWRSV